MPKAKRENQKPTKKTPPPKTPPPAPKTPGTAVVPAGQVRDTNLKYKIQRGINRAKAGLHKAKTAATRNKAALIAAGLTAAGAGALGYAAGKRQSQAKDE